jgi:4-hydroxythreonine-4-phosphate dehydrogenase
MNKKNKQPIITLGSPYGVGYEIFLLSLREKIFNDSIPVCIGSSMVMNFFIKLLKVKVNYKSITLKNIDNKINKINNEDFILIDIDEEKKQIEVLDDIDKSFDGLCALKSIDKAAFLVDEGYFSSVVTLPVCKKNINIFNKKFKGHTEFFQKKWNEDKVFMCFISDKLNMILLTTHLPLNKVSKNITPKLVDSAIITAINLYNKLGLKKDICFLGLNPHAGEKGLLGKEDIWMEKIIEKHKKRFDKIVGPVPSDTAFTSFNIGKYDLFIACYHDQGLIPFKMLSFEDGVNLSFGMKYIRTSVDHGTATGLIGKKIASTASFINAYKLAVKLTN